MEWKRAPSEYNGETTDKMKLVPVEDTRKNFIDEVLPEVKEFRSHIERAKVQYKELQNLKRNLPRDHTICQMDFAQNYTCSHAVEIQSAYFAKPSVPLHPMVVYYRDGTDGELKHKSFIMTTDEMSHKAFSVFAFMQRIQPQIKKLISDCKLVHYLTDSPTSHYRNRTIFYVISHHFELLGTYAGWLYFEAGHGKSACDGIGGSF